MPERRPCAAFVQGRLPKPCTRYSELLHLQFEPPWEVKPPNILVSNSLHEVKLADFGISKILEASGHAGRSSACGRGAGV